jgi:kinesin family protein 11
MFDDVFGPNSTQDRVYDSAVRPMVKDVLEGMNCTVFAYGQTGTGKTFTMSGAHDAECDVLSSEAGVIPRAMSHVFEHLDSKELEYSVKVTYLELYNEEITDLLGPPLEADGSNKTKHTLMEDGKGGVAVKGLEEVYVSSIQEVFAVLNRGNTRRRTEETLLNKHSSRSHSVFSVTVHVKDVSPDGEEFVRCGKLNLVDLAGSENISRSGAKDSRAREAGEINKSLVALGRVITALVDKSGHVPYRDSKLTRLLRDALGGRCKTCVIATVSPASHSVEETLSTLEYAHRAKNIKNKPLMNGKVPKNVFLKELQDCIERLQGDLIATREKNGVFMSKANYDAEQSEHASTRRRAEELENALSSMQAEHDKVERMFDKTKKNFLQLKEQHAYG